MNKSIFIKLNFAFLLATMAFNIYGQSIFNWNYLDVTTIDEPLDNLYSNLEIRHLDLNDNCASNEALPTTFQIFNSSQNEYEVYFFSGNDGMNISAEIYIKDVSRGEISCFNQEDLGLQTIGDVVLDYSSNQIILADYASKKLVFVTPTGIIESSIDVPFDFVHVTVANNKFFFHVLDFNEDNSADIIKVCSPQLNLLKEYRFPSSNRVIRGFSKNGSLRRDNNTVYFNPTYDINIYEINEVEKRVIFSLDDFVVNDDFKKDPFITYLVRDNILYFTQTLFNGYYSFIVDLENKEVFVVHNSIPILSNKTGFEYNYVFSPVTYSNLNGFITYISSRSANKTHSLEGHQADHIDLTDAVSNIKKLGFCDNEHNFMMYDYNFDFLRRNSNDDLSSVFPIADKVNLDCGGLTFNTVYNSNNTITVELISNTDMEVEVGLFSLLERTRLEKIKVEAGIKKYHTIEVPQRQKSIGFVHLRNSLGCRSTKQVFIN